MPHSWVKRLLALGFLTSAILLGNAFYIPLKAAVAQQLLQRSWDKTQAGLSNAKPWPWADTTAIGVLEVPKLDIHQLILSGTSGRNLAFGPTLLNPHHSVGSPESFQGDIILSGHRDTHFSFLSELTENTLLTIQSSNGRTSYRVSQIEVIDIRQRRLVTELGIQRLTLVTCYPFTGLGGTTPYRFVVSASAVPD